MTDPKTRPQAVPPWLHAERLYRGQPLVKGIKTLLEMVIGTITVVAVLFRTGSDIIHLRVPDESVIFHIIAGGLAVVAAVELGYTLFTPSPGDEIINPLMIGLSSALLFKLSQADLSWSSGIGALLFIGALAALFKIRRNVEAEEQSRAERESPSGSGGAE